MAKLIQTSLDGVTYSTLPGSSGDLNHEGSSAEDTIFGNSFSSSQPTLVGWTLSANAFYKGYAGYTTTFKKTGTSTATTGESMSVVSGQTYAIDDTTKEVWDYNNAITVYDNSISVDAANIESIDHLFGRVTFTSGYSVTGPVTVDVNYLPLSAVGTSREFSLTMNAESVDTTDFATAQANGGYMTYTQGLRTVGIDASGFYQLSNGFVDLVNARSELVIEIDLGAQGETVARGFFKAISTGQSGDVGGNEDETITFELSVPDDADVVTPFKWLHASGTTLSTGIKNVLDAWQDESDIEIKYLHDGTNGYSGTGVVTDCSLSTSIDGMSEFSVSVQGSGATASVP